MAARRLRAILAVGIALSIGASPAWSQRVAGARPDLSGDEGGLWAAADKAELQAKASAEIDTDPVLNAYVKEVTCKVAPEYCSDIRLYVMDRPFFNAQMAPNGYAEVWSGLLLRAGDESEMAFVIGHEVTHFATDDTIVAYRAERGRLNTAMAFGIAFGGLGLDLAYLAGMASASSFSRTQESAADLGGLRRLRAAGYAPEASVAIWKALLDETAASDFDAVRKAPTKGSIFNSHPLDADRIAALQKAIGSASGGEAGRDRYRAMIRPHLASWLRDDLRRRDYGQTLAIINRLAADGEDAGLLNFFKGEAYRLRHKDGDTVLAAKAYADASAQPDAPVDVWRELGEARRKQNDKDGARTAFQTYLAKAPNAEDAWLVTDTLKSL